MVKALETAKTLWNNPGDLIALWETLDSKKRHEALVASYVGVVDKVVDLGCGAGRYAQVLKCEQYQGYDGSLPMILEAKQRNPGKEFSVVDIFAFQPGEEYDAAIMIDVAHHQDQPVDAILTVMRNWVARRYIFTLLVGDKREDLYNSTIVPFTEVLQIYDRCTVLDTYIERFDNNNFAWWLIEAER